MKRNKLQSSKAGRSLTGVIMAGVIIATLLSLLLSALMSSFVLSGRLQEGSVRAVSFIIRLISVFAGALIGGVLSKEKYLLQVGLTALGYMLVLIGTGIVIYNGSFRHFLSGAGSVLIGAVSAFLILQKQNTKGHKITKISL